jgi:ring-1,2-phenylacetyl-CoA epoxidase subunit PaaE
MQLSFSITAIQQETPDTKTFYLRQTAGTPIQYKAGQFLTFLFTDGGQQVRRSYSLGSTPGIDDVIFITVKRKPNGSISRQLADHYHPGDTLTAIPPSGRFVLVQPVTAQTHVFIAAGSGITPVFALIKQLLHHQPQTNVLLVNQSRDEQDVIYAAHLSQLQQQFAGRFTIIQLYSNPASHQYLPQRLNNTLLEGMVKKALSNTPLASIQFYLCGPTAFMLMAQFTLKLLHCTDGQILREQFVITPPAAPPPLHDTTPKTVTIFYQQQQYQLQVAWPATILQAALQQSIPLPYSCRAGICSACTATCANGNITMGTNEVLTEKDLKNGLVLTCTGYALTNCTITYAQ